MAYTQDLAAPLSQVLNDGTNTYLYGLDRLASVNASSRTWELHDALGSVRMHLDDAGTPLSASGLAYTPFGLPQSGALPQPFGFVGELHSGDLLYLRARWYDPSSGTFTSVDPFEGFDTRPYSLHPYQYGYADPVRYSDPSGWFSSERSDNGGGIRWGQYRHRYWMEISLSPETYRAMNEAIGSAISDFQSIESQREWVFFVGTLFAGGAAPVGTILTRVGVGSIVAGGVEAGVDVGIELLDSSFSVPDLLDPLSSVQDNRQTLEEWRQWISLYYTQVVEDYLERGTTNAPPIEIWIEDRSECYHGDEWTGNPLTCMCTFGLREGYATGASWPGVERLRSVGMDDFFREIHKHTYLGLRDAVSWDGYSWTSFGSPMYDDENGLPR